MKDVKNMDYSIADQNELMAIKKILEEKYPDEDIQEIIKEGDICRLHEMMFSR